LESVRATSVGPSDERLRAPELSDGHRVSPGSRPGARWSVAAADVPPLRVQRFAWLPPQPSSDGADGLSDAMDGHVVGAGRESAEIPEVAAEDGAAGLSRGDDDRIDGRAPTCLRPQRCRPSGERLGKRFPDVGDLEAPVD